MNIGSSLTVNVGTLQYSLNILIVAVPAAVAGLIILLVLIFSITCCLYVRFKMSNKERDRQFQGLLAQMELMESELAEECRRGGLQLCGCACVGVSSPCALWNPSGSMLFQLAHWSHFHYTACFKCTVVLGVHAHSLAACIHLCTTCVHLVVEWESLC